MRIHSMMSTDLMKGHLAMSPGALKVHLCESMLKCTQRAILKCTRHGLFPQRVFFAVFRVPGLSAPGDATGPGDGPGAVTETGDGPGAVTETGDAPGNLHWKHPSFNRGTLDRGTLDRLITETSPSIGKCQGSSRSTDKPLKPDQHTLSNTQYQSFAFELQKHSTTPDQKSCCKFWPTPLSQAIWHNPHAKG